MFPIFENSENIRINLDEINDFSGEVHLKREDELHPHVSGNKFRKLKYNIHLASIQEKKTLLTFGGAFSNHIAAVAAAGQAANLNTVGIIRGDELKNDYKNNPTLQFAEQCGMQFEFVSREVYRQKDSTTFQQQLLRKYPHCYLLPEGGTNELAVRGCKEIITADDAAFNFICTPVGTGGTLAGLVAASKNHQTVIGYSALKGTFQHTEISKYTSKSNYTIKDAYCFGGYAKIDSQLVRFMNSFKEQTGILLDPVYTAKMLFGIVRDIKTGYFPENSRILAIHTGGLQGISGMNQRLKQKKLPQIHT